MQHDLTFVQSFGLCSLQDAEEKSGFPNLLPTPFIVVDLAYLCCSSVAVASGLSGETLRYKEFMFHNNLRQAPNT